MIEHIVLLRARDGREAELDAALDEFVTEIIELDTVREISAGPNFNKGGAARGWTHGMRVLLTEREALPGYWDHPSHVRLAETLDEVCRDRFAIDYERTE